MVGGGHSRPVMSSQNDAPFLKKDRGDPITIEVSEDQAQFLQRLGLRCLLKEKFKTAGAAFLRHTKKDDTQQQGSQ